MSGGNPVRTREGVCLTGRNEAGHSDLGNTE